MKFSFYLSENEYSNSIISLKSSIGRYIFSKDEFTPMDFFEAGNRAVFIYGLCVNVLDGVCDNLAKSLLENTDDIDSVISYEANLGGKYLIVYKENDNYYLIPDATGSIPIFYNTDSNKFAVASNYKFLVDEFNYFPDETLLKIRKSGDISQAMPYDVTEYKEIKQLLPNHYLLLNNQMSVRFINHVYKDEEISYKKAANITYEMILNLTRFYTSHFNCLCPITGGRDSRVVLAALMHIFGNNICAYTIKHDGHNEYSQDLTIPQKIIQKIRISYTVLNDLPLRQEIIDEFDTLLGEDQYSKRTLMIANTIKSNFENSAIINGDIIGQVGKCSLHRDIPEIFSTAGYFRCKLHNYSKDSKKLLKFWLNEIKNSGEKVNVFDLFSIESRMGRWAGQENLIYNSIELPSLNVFNSRNIIYKWTDVSRKERKNSLLHEELIKIFNKELLEIEFESDDNFFVRLSKKNGIFYYIFSFLKFFAQKILFVLRK